jgi:hypothetical protein
MNAVVLAPAMFGKKKKKKKNKAIPVTGREGP